MTSPGRSVDRKAALNIAQAKARFSELVKRAEAGEEIVISRGNRPACRLTPLEPRPRRQAGRLRHLMSDADWRVLIAAVEAPMSENELAETEGATKPLFNEVEKP